MARLATDRHDGAVGGERVGDGHRQRREAHVPQHPIELCNGKFQSPKGPFDRDFPGAGGADKHVVLWLRKRFPRGIA